MGITEPTISATARKVAWTRTKTIVTLVVVAAIAIGLTLFFTLGGGHSLSYKDGYQYGKSDFKSGGLPTDCFAHNDYSPPSYVPSGDNGSEWSQGCIDGYGAAQFKDSHPGA